MLHDDSPTKRKAASALAETRLALTSLKSFKRRNIANAPVQRIGENIRSMAPGVVRQQGLDNRMPNSNVLVHVYEVSHKIYYMNKNITLQYRINQTNASSEGKYLIYLRCKILYNKTFVLFLK